jgi:hypothetical protein
METFMTLWRESGALREVMNHHIGRDPISVEQAREELEQIVRARDVKMSVKYRHRLSENFRLKFESR